MSRCNLCARTSEQALLNSRQPSRRLRAAIILAAAALSSQVHGASTSFVSAPTDANWATGTNWASGTAPGTAAGGYSNSTRNNDVATFNNAISGGIGSAANPIVIDANRFLKGITFDGNAGAFVIGASGGGSLQLDSGGSISMTASVTNPEVINSTMLYRVASSTNATYSFVNNSTTSTATLLFNTAALSLVSGNGSRPTTLTLDGTNTGNNTISSAITDSDGQGVNVITKNGTGTWILAGANTFTGSGATNVANGIQINAGVLSAQNNTALGTSGTANANQVSINNTGILELANNITLDNGISLNLNTGGTIRANGPITTNGRINLSTVATTTATIATVNATDVFTVGNGANDVTGGSSTAVMNVAGPGEVLLNSSNNVTGTWNVTGSGSLALASGASLGTSTLNFAAGATGKIQLNNSVTVNGLSSDATASSAVIENGSGSNIVLTANNASDLTYNSHLQDGSGGGNLGMNKGGAGALTLTANNTYTGDTNVNLGTLRVNNTTGSATGTGNVNIQVGATLSGTGTINGAVDIKSGGTLAPGNGVGTIHVSSLTLDAGAKLTYEFNGTSNDLTQVFSNSASALTLNGGTLTLFTENTTNPFDPNPSSTTGTKFTYHLFQSSGSIAGSVDNLSIANPVAGYAYSFSFSNAGGFNDVDLTLTRQGSTSVWATNSDGNWSTPANWVGGVVPSGAGNLAQFAGASTHSVNLDADFSIGGIEFNDATAGYTLASTTNHTLTFDNGATPASIKDTAGSHTMSVNVGLNSNAIVSVANAADSLTMSGNISGSGALSKTGPGILVLAGNSTYTGGTGVTGGTVQFSQNSNFGTGSVTLDGGALKWTTSTASDISTQVLAIGLGGGTLDTNGNDVTLTNAIGSNGAGGITKAGAGKLTLANNNTFAAGVTVNGGAIAISDDSALGTVPGTATTNLTFNPGAGNSASLIANAAVTLNANRNVSIASGTAILDTQGVNVGDPSNNITINGTISGAGGIEKKGVGILTLNGSASFGGMTIDGGTVALGAANAINGTVTFSGNATNYGTLAIGALKPAMTLKVPANNFAGVSAGNVGGVGAVVGDASGNGGTLNIGMTSSNFDLTGDLTAFNGTINFTGSGGIRLFGTTGSSLATFNLNDRGMNVRSTATAIAFGALNGVAGSSLVGQTANGGGTLTTFTIGGNNSDSLYGGSINNAGSAQPSTTAIVKTGTGKLTLTGTSTYSGATTINGGRLEIGDGALIDQTSAVTINNGGTLLITGSGTFIGEGPTPTTYTINSGGAIDVTGYVNPNDTSKNGSFSPFANNSGTLVSSGTLYGKLNLSNGTFVVGGTNTVGTATINGSAALAGSLNFDVANVTTVGNGINDLLNVNGDISIDGGVKFRVNILGGTPAAVGQHYQLIDYTGVDQGNIGNVGGNLFVFNTRGSFHLEENTTDLTRHVDLVVDSLGNPANLFYASGSQTDNWDLQQTQNWFNAGTSGNDFFYTNDNVTFDDTHYTGASPATVNVTQVLQPQSLTVNSSTVDYTFAMTGTGRITGSTSLVKGGSSILTLSNSNDFTGGTVVNGGTIVTGGQGSNALGTGSITLNNAGAIAVTGTSTTTFGTQINLPANQTGTVAMNGTGLVGVISGQLTGTGTVALTSDKSGKIIDIDGNNTAFGGTIMTTGDALIRVTSVGSGAGVTWNLNATGSTLGANTSGGATIPMAAIIGVTGSTLKGYTANGTGGNITYQIGTLSGSYNFAGNVIDGNSGATVRPVTISKVGADTQIFSGSNSYTGGTSVAAGTLQFAGANAWGPALNNASTNITGGTLSFDYSADPLSDPKSAALAKLAASYSTGTPWTSGQFRTPTDAIHSIGWIDDTANSRFNVVYVVNGDANFSGVVGTGDFTALAQHFNNANLATAGSPTWSEGDFNYDGKVNALDFNILATNFGQTLSAPPALGTLVPEPASLGLLVLAGVSLVSRRRRR